MEIPTALNFLPSNSGLDSVADFGILSPLIIEKFTPPFSKRLPLEMTRVIPLPRPSSLSQASLSKLDFESKLPNSSQISF